MYCLAVWCPHTAPSCPLVAVEDSLSSHSLPLHVSDRSPQPVSFLSALTRRLQPIWPPDSNKACPPAVRGHREEEKVKDSQIPSDSPWSVASNYSELIFSAWLISKWIKWGPYYCWPVAPLKELREDQVCGLRCQSGSDPWGEGAAVM